MKKIFNGSSLLLTLAFVIYGASLFVYFSSPYDGVITHFMREGLYDWNDSIRYVAYCVIAQTLTSILLLILIVKNNEKSLLGLWVKRRRMEEERKIAQLENNK